MDNSLWLGPVARLLLWCPVVPVHLYICNGHICFVCLAQVCPQGVLKHPAVAGKPRCKSLVPHEAHHGLTVKQACSLSACRWLDGFSIDGAWASSHPRRDCGMWWRWCSRAMAARRTVTGAGRALPSPVTPPAREQARLSSAAGDHEKHKSAAHSIAVRTWRHRVGHERHAILLADVPLQGLCRRVRNLMAARQSQGWLVGACLHQQQSWTAIQRHAAHVHRGCGRVIKRRRVAAPVQAQQHDVVAAV